MKLKSLLLGSAAVFAAGAGAQAADLPTAEPVEYVRICDAFGTGFYYIPGTDTCLKVSGQVRAEAHYVFQEDDDDDADFDFFGDDDNPLFNNYTTRARGNVRVDARTQTDFGLIRAFIDLELTVGPSQSFTSTFDDPLTDDDETDIGSPNYAGTGSNLAAAFVQITNDWGTFTAGHTGSFFDFFGSYDFGTRIDIDDNTTEQTLFAYTFGGGNGFSFTVSAEDPSSSGRRLAGGPFFAPDAIDFGTIYGGQEFPDGVANIRIDQGWGSAQIMGVVGQLHSADAIDLDGDDDPDVLSDDDDIDDIGWAVGAGLSTKVPFLGGLEFSAQAGYSEGKLGYISTDVGGFGDFLFDDPEATSEGWNVRAGIRGRFGEKVTASIGGSYTHVEYDEEDVDTTFDGVGDTDIDSDYDYFAVVANIIWTPVEGLSMGPEVGYRHIEFGGDDVEGIGLIDEDDAEDDQFGAMFRVQRAF